MTYPQHMIQFVDTFAGEEAAQDVLSACTLQEGYQGGRVYHDDTDHVWKVQAFFSDFPSDRDLSTLPDGCRRVLVLPGQRAALGIEVQA